MGRTARFLYGGLGSVARACPADQSPTLGRPGPAPTSYRPAEPSDRAFRAWSRLRRARESVVGRGPGMAWSGRPSSRHSAGHEGRLVQVGTPRERVRELGRGRFLVGPALGQHWTNRAPAGCCLLAQSGHVGSPQTAHLGTLCTRRLAVAPPSAEPGWGTVRPRWGHRRGDAADKLAWCASGSRASDRPDCLKPSPLGLAVPRPRSVAHRCRDSGGMLRRPARRQRFGSVGEDER